MQSNLLTVSHWNGPHAAKNEDRFPDLQASCLGQGSIRFHVSLLQALRFVLGLRLRLGFRLRCRRCRLLALSEDPRRSNVRCVGPRATATQRRDSQTAARTERISQVCWQPGKGNQSTCFADSAGVGSFPAWADLHGGTYDFLMCFNQDGACADSTLRCLLLVFAGLHS